MPKVTEEHLEARRRQILSASYRCFARQGFHRTTMQDIFREAELSPGAVYSYFPSKDAIVEAAIAESMAFIADLVAVVLTARDENRLLRPGAALAEVMTRFDAVELGTAEERARLFPHLVGELQREPELRTTVRQGLEQLAAGFAELARSALQRGELDPRVDPEDFGRVAISILQGTLIQYGLFSDTMDLVRHAEAVEALLDPPEGRREDG